MKVYWKNTDGKLAVFAVDVEYPDEAVLSVKEELVASGEGFTGAVLAVITGGSNAKS